MHYTSSMSAVTFCKNTPFCVCLGQSILSLILFLMSHSTTKPTKWPMGPAKTQISPGMRPVWSESLLSAWRNHGSLATHWAHNEDWSWSDWMDAQADLSLRWLHKWCHAAAQIVFSPEEDGGKPKEWAMVELQGSLETRHPVPLSGKFIGDLHFTHKVSSTALLFD